MYLRLKDKQALHIRVIGRGYPVIVLHGIFMSSDYWLPYVLPLAHKYKFIIPDMRGHGKSHNVPFSVDHALENYAEDLRELIEYFDYPSYKLAGLSMGGAASWMYLRKYKMERIKEYLNIDQGIRFFNSEDWKYGFAGERQKEFFDTAYLLIGESIKYPQTPFSKLPTPLKNLFDEQFADFAALAFPNPLFKRVIKVVMHHLHGARLTLPLSSWQNYIHCVTSYMQDFDFTEDLKTMTIPTSLFIGVKNDMYPPEGQRYMASLLQKNKVPVTITEFHQSGHALMMTEPVKFIKALDQFCRKSDD